MQEQVIIEERLSLHYSPRNITPKYIVLHCIGYDDPLQILNETQTSCHYLIPQQKSSNPLIAYEVVKPPLRAWHAGISHWKNYSGLNDWALGIEINMPDYAHALEKNKTLDFLFFTDYQKLQIEILKILVKRLQKQFSIPAENIIAHSDIAPWRDIAGKIVMSKTDPGPTLPWNKLACTNIGVWPKADCPQSVKNNLTAAHAQQLLTDVGYKIPASGIFDQETNLTIGAARLRWSPTCFKPANGSAHACYEKTFDAELACSLYNVANKNYDTCNTNTGNTNTWGLVGLLACSGGGLLLLFLVCHLFKCWHVNRSESSPLLEQEEETKPMQIRNCL